MASRAPVRLLVIARESDRLDRLLKGLADQAVLPILAFRRDTLADGIGFIEESDPDVILVDVASDDASPIETIQAVAKVVASTPTIALTPSDDLDLDLALRCLDAGADDVLPVGARRSDVARIVYLAHGRAGARREAEALHASVRRALADSRDATVVLDSDGRVRFANAEAEALFGARVAEGTGFGQAHEGLGAREVDIQTEAGHFITVEMLVGATIWIGEYARVVTFRDVSERVRAKTEVDRLNVELRLRARELEDALEQVRTLKGLVPICAYCKSVRDDEDFWQTVEQYLAQRTDATFSHGICPDCQSKYFPELD